MMRAALDWSAREKRLILCVSRLAERARCTTVSAAERTRYAWLCLLLKRSQRATEPVRHVAVREQFGYSTEVAADRKKPARRKEKMKRKIVAIIIAFSCASTLAAAQHIPLSCGDYVLLTETAVHHRDTKITKEKSKYYLHDDSLSPEENRKVRAMIDRIYASPSKDKSYFVAQAYRDCKTFK